jgi:hypothetical protein
LVLRVLRNLNAAGRGRTADAFVGNLWKP